MPETFTFDAAIIKRLRRRATKAWEDPLLQSELPEGWFISPVDPMRVAKKFRTLKIKPEYVLRAYQFHQHGNGNGVVYAMPCDAEFPPPTAIASLFAPPQPTGALADVMEAFDGDDTPWSYLCASLLARELSEFGAIWHGASWVDVAILDDDPRKSRVIRGSTPGEWEWSAPLPTLWGPTVTVSQDEVRVRFYTYRPQMTESIDQHDDVFKPGRYVFQTDFTTIAQGPGGIVY